MADKDDITGLWDSAVAKYRAATGVDLFALSTPQVQSVDDVMKLTVDKEEHFKKWRNDGGKIAKFRSILKASLGPLTILGGFAVQGASTVSRRSLIDLCQLYLQRATRTDGRYWTRCFRLARRS